MDEMHPIIMSGESVMTSPSPAPTNAYNNLSTATMARLDASGDNDEHSEYVYGRWDVQAIFLTVYSSVFFTCFLGNLMVILVVTLHWRMRSVTNFCLANLAFADLCVSVFCIYQNLYMYIMSSWVFGAFLCKMYFFITELSHTASILILVVICIERYLAIIHPMRCKEWLTLSRLRLTIVGVWSLSAVYSCPKLVFSDITSHSYDGIDEILCIPIRTAYDSKTYDMMSMGLLFLLPLSVISILYTRIGIVLWTSSSGQMTMTNTGRAHPVMNNGHKPADIVNEPSSSTSNGIADGPNGPMLKRQVHVSCIEILCGGCTMQSWNCCCKAILNCRMKSKSVGNVRSQKFNTEEIPMAADNNDSLHNYYCPSNPSSSANASNNPAIELRNSSEAKPHGGILKSNPTNSLSSNNKSSSSSSSTTSSSSTPCEPKIISTEPIVVVKFDNTLEKNNKKNGHCSNKTTRAHCTILMKSASEQLLAEGSSQLESPLLENGGNCMETSIDNPVNCSTNPSMNNESPIIQPRHSNSVAWSDKKLDSASSSTKQGKNFSVKYHLNNTSICIRSCNTPSTAINTNGANNNNRVRRMRVIRSCTYGTRALQSRRRVIRMLVVIVFVFAMCNLPFHARKVWQYWGSGYIGGSTFSSLLTPITFLIMYMNSAINPILYAFMSKKFRLSFWDLLTCRIRRSLRIARNASVRSTHVVPMSTAIS